MNIQAPKSSSQTNDYAEGIRRQDPVALEKFFKSEGPTLKAVALRVVHHESDANDIFIKALQEIWARIGSYNPEKGNFLGWCITLVRRRSIDFLRSRDAEWERINKFECQTTNGESFVAPAVKNPHNHHCEVYTELRSLISHPSIPPEQAQCLQLHWFEGLSQRDIAQRLNLPLGTVKTRLELGLKKLKSVATNNALFSEDERRLSYAA